MKNRTVRLGLIATGIVQRRSIVIVSRIWIGAVMQQEIDHFKRGPGAKTHADHCRVVTGAASVDEGRAAILEGWVTGVYHFGHVSEVLKFQFNLKTRIKGGVVAFRF